MLNSKSATVDFVPGTGTLKVLQNAKESFATAGYTLGDADQDRLAFEVSSVELDARRCFFAWI